MAAVTIVWLWVIRESLLSCWLIIEKGAVGSTSVVASLSASLHINPSRRLKSTLLCSSLRIRNPLSVKIRRWPWGLSPQTPRQAWEGFLRLPCGRWMSAQGEPRPVLTFLWRLWTLLWGTGPVYAINDERGLQRGEAGNAAGDLEQGIRHRKKPHHRLSWGLAWGMAGTPRLRNLLSLLRQGVRLE